MSTVLDEKDALTVVSILGKALWFIAEESKTYKVCLAAVCQNGLTLATVPTGMRGYGLCRAAVRQNGSAIRFVPNRFLTTPFCCYAMEHGAKLVDIPQDMITLEMCYRELERTHSLETIPPECIDTNLAYAAVVYAERNIKYVPQHLWTERLLALAPTFSSGLIDGVPRDHLDSWLGDYPDVTASSCRDRLRELISNRPRQMERRAPLPTLRKR